MNNKGQSLVTFVLIVPIVFLIFLMVYDIGTMVLLKNELDDINYMVMDYGLEHLSDDDINGKLQELIIKNRKNVNIDIKILDDKMYIELSDKIDNKLSLINKITLVKSAYVGYMEDNTKIIKKNK